MTPPRIRIELFGGLRVEATGDGPIDFSRRQTGAILGYLALHCDRNHDREELVAIFWPEDDAESGRRKLRQSLYALRRQFELNAAGGPGLFTSTRDTVGFDAKAISTDVREFESAIRQAALCEEPRERLKHLARADEIYRGEFLAGFYQEVFSAIRSDLAARHLAALHEILRTQEQLGDLDSATAAARRIVALNPLAEESHAELMRLYAAAGRPGEVRRQLRALEKLLEAELGVKPAGAIYAAVDRMCAEAELRHQVSPDRSAAAPPPRMPHAAGRRSGEGSALRGKVGAALVLLAVTLLVGLCLRVTWMSRKLASSNPAMIPLDLPEPRIIWSRIIPIEAGDNWSEPSGIAIDSRDNIYVTGFVNTTKTDTDYLTQKLSPSGETLWQRRYNGTGNDVDRARGVIVDLDGNVVVTGDSDNGKGLGDRRGKGLDIVTVKYDTAGNQKYAIRWNGASDGEDRPCKIIPDYRNGGAIVAGSSWDRAANRGRGGFQMVCLRLDRHATDRSLPTYATTYLGSGHLDARPNDLTLGVAGEVYLVGSSATGAKAGPDSESVALRINENGKIEWVNPVGGKPLSGNARPFISGDKIASADTTVSRGAVRSSALTTLITAGGSTLWERAFNSQSQTDDTPTAMCGGYAGQVYIAGQFFALGGAEHVSLVSYDGHGIRHWARLFSAVNSGPDMATCLKWKDDALFVAGYSTTSRDRGRTSDFKLLLLKLRAHDGEPLYMSRSIPIQGDGGNLPAAESIQMVLDTHGDVIVTCQVVKDGRNAIEVVKFAP